MEWEDGTGGYWVNDTEYTLKQLHWHTPSEHTLNGKRFAAELHMVHKSADNKIAVVGVLYRFGYPDSFLSEVIVFLTKYSIHFYIERENKTIQVRYIG